MVQIIEILGRSEQGITHPFICRGNDDNTYFVKGIGAGRRDQVCEWIAGNLGVELNYAGIERVPDDLQRDVLAFDWWIRNNDRTLSESGGNPNLFWEPEKEQLVIIDHNQAFDPDFSVDNILQYHVFSEQHHGMFDDVFYRQKYEKDFQASLNRWSDICDNIPEEWHYLDTEMSIPANIQLDAIFITLNRCNSEELWDHT